MDLFIETSTVSSIFETPALNKLSSRFSMLSSFCNLARTMSIFLVSRSTAELDYRRSFRSLTRCYNLPDKICFPLGMLHYQTVIQVYLFSSQTLNIGHTGITKHGVPYARPNCPPSCPVRGIVGTSPTLPVMSCSHCHDLGLCMCTWKLLRPSFF